MKIRSAVALVPTLVVALGFGALGACGSRTSLVDEGEEEQQSTPDAARPDAQHLDSSVDVQAPIDATPPVEASVCPAGTILAYILSDNAQLYTFDPPTLQTKLLGSISCPSASTPWSLTASSSGILYVIYEDWNIYKVDPTTLSCVATPYVPFQNGLGTNTGITTLSDQGTESLYVYGQDNSGNGLLDVGDLTDFDMTTVGTVLPAPTDLTLDVRANAFGRIFGLGTTGSFVEIDRKTAARISEDDTGFVSRGAWALLAWNDTFYFFSDTAVSQYDSTAKTLTNLGSVGIQVVGASAAPCIH